MKKICLNKIDSQTGAKEKTQSLRIFRSLQQFLLLNAISSHIGNENKNSYHVEASGIMTFRFFQLAKGTFLVMWPAQINRCDKKNDIFLS